MPIANGYWDESMWQNVDFAAWKKRWPNFHPLEICSKDNGSIHLSLDAMDKLQAFRSTMGRPFVVLSGYRTPQHNAAIGGAAKSMHLQGKAFDISMANHDPAEFYKAALEQGFTGIGFYPEPHGNFMHIDIGTRRWWGEPAPWGIDPVA